MDIRSFGLGFGAGAGVVLGIFGIKKLIARKKEEKKEDVNTDVSNFPDPPSSEPFKKEEKPLEKEEDEVPNEQELFRNLSAPYIPESPPEEKKDDDKDIFEISEEEFFLAQGARKIFLTYYGIDGVLADEADEIVEDPARLVGDLVFGYFVNGGKMTLHLRNQREGCVIEIGRVSESYEETHGGDDI